MAMASLAWSAKCWASSPEIRLASSWNAWSSLTLPRGEAFDTVALGVGAELVAFNDHREVAAASIALGSDTVG